MRSIAVAAVVLTALVLGTAAGADRERVQLTKAGQKAARAAVLRRADLRPAGGWQGRHKKPSLSSTTGCPNFHPKQSDLVLIGAAETVWKHRGIQFDSEAQVLRTPKMVRLDWQRTVKAPKVLPCLRHNVRKSLTANERLSYISRLPFPGLGGLTRLYRTVIVVHAAGGKTPVLVDVLLFGRGRTELTLTTTALYSARKTVTREERRLARILLRRAR